MLRQPAVEEKNSAITREKKSDILVRVTRTFSLDIGLHFSGAPPTDFFPPSAAALDTRRYKSWIAGYILLDAREASLRSFIEITVADRARGYYSSARLHGCESNKKTRDFQLDKWNFSL